MMTTARLKDLGEFRNGLTYSPENICDADEGILVLRSSNIQDEKISLLDNVYVNVSLPRNMLVNDGDILICSRNGSARLVGKTAIIENGLHATWGAFMMLFKTPQNSRYMYYLLNASISKSKGLFSTSTINQLTNSMLGNIYVDFFSDKEEQEQIVSYLDTKTAAIDKRIEVLEKKQEVYSRLRKSIINRAVTRGLNPNVSLKDSGVDWIGMIPEHWEVQLFNNTIERISTGLNPRDNFNLNEGDCNKYYVTIRNFKNGKLHLDDNCDMITTEAWEIIQRRSNLKKGDILFASISDTPQLYIVQENWREWNINESVFTIRLKKEIIENRYFVYHIQCILYYGYLRAKATGSTFTSIKQDNLLHSFLVIPPLPEQRAIADYLDEKCTKIDAAVENIGKQVYALKRLKRALINEVVTGKRKV